MQPIIWLLLFGALFKAVTAHPRLPRRLLHRLPDPGRRRDARRVLGRLDRHGLHRGHQQRRDGPDARLAGLARARSTPGPSRTASATVVIQTVADRAAGAGARGRLHGRRRRRGAADRWSRRCSARSFASLSNGVALLARQRETLIGAVTFVQLPLTFLSAALMQQSLVPGGSGRSRSSTRSTGPSWPAARRRCRRSTGAWWPAGSACWSALAARLRRVCDAGVRQVSARRCSERRHRAGGGPTRLPAAAVFHERTSQPCRTVPPSSPGPPAGSALRSRRLLGGGGLRPDDRRPQARDARGDRRGAARRGLRRRARRRQHGRRGGDPARWSRRHRERYGRLDVLVNNAGVGIGAAAGEHQTKYLDMQLAVNLRSIILFYRECARAAARGRAPSTATRWSSTSPRSPASRRSRGCRSTRRRRPR